MLGEEDVAQGFGSVNVNLQIVNKENPNKSKNNQKESKKVMTKCRAKLSLSKLYDLYFLL